MAAKKRTPDLETEIGDLYALPLSEFTPARNALAARLKKEGDREGSERVKGLAKPSVSAWAVNVLFRDERETMDALLAAGERAREALRHALTHGAADVLRDALEEERELRDDLRRRAVALIGEGGGAPGRAIVDRIVVNLEALALSPSAAAEAERGWLDRDLDPPGFEVLAGLQLGAGRPARPDPSDHRGLRLVPKPKPESKPEPEPKKTAPADLDQKRRQREEKAERERRERVEAKARERIARAEEKLAKAAEEAAAQGGEAERLERAAADAERAAEEARRRAESAREAAERARARAEKAEESRARAAADLEALR
jgi:hypothetical protein